jgi:hypothetical protein
MKYLIAGIFLFAFGNSTVFGENPSPNLLPENKLTAPFIEMFGSNLGPETSPLEYWKERIREAESVKCHDEYLFFFSVDPMGEGGDERLVGVYRNNGTLKEVRDDLSTIANNPNFQAEFHGKLKKTYSEDGALLTFTGTMRAEQFENGKRETFVINNPDDDYAGFFEKDLVPLKIPKELLAFTPPEDCQNQKIARLTLGDTPEKIDGDLDVEDAYAQNSFTKYLYRTYKNYNDITEQIKGAELIKASDGYSFSFIFLVPGRALSFHQGPHIEKYQGLYRRDGTLDYVTHDLYDIGFAGGDTDTVFEGKLTRKFSNKGVLSKISGYLNSRNLTERKIEKEKINEMPKYGDSRFNLDFPPLKLPVNLFDNL